jgi:hypothetical protein
MRAERAWVEVGDNSTWMQEVLGLETGGGLIAAALRILTRRVR